MRGIIALIVRTIASVAVTLGIAAVARTFTQPPDEAAQLDGHRSAPPTIGALQHDEEAPLRPGWSRARPERLPRPTYWPVTLALGIALILWGIITTYYLWSVGLVFFAVGAVGWIGELVYESK